MSKGSNRRGKGAGGKSGRGSSAPGSLSLSAFRAERQVDALTPAFVQWFDDGSPGAAAAALECLVPVKSVLARYLETTAASEVTGFEPTSLVHAMSDGIAAAAGESATEPVDGENAAFILDAVRAYVEFLSETGRWSGSAEQLAEVSDLFEGIAEGDDGPRYIEVPEIPEAQALAVFSELPLIQRAAALLRWIGAGRPVTETGALRLRDIEAAAACVGVTVKGSTKRVITADSAPTVQSMYEVPALTHMWGALQAAELIEFTSTKVVPFEDSESFLKGSTSERLDEFQVFTSCFLEQAVLRYDPAQPWERMLAGLQTSLLMAAATPDPPSVELFLTAADHAPDAEKAMASLLTRLALGRFEALAELGLLTIDTHFRVPESLVGCVADTFDNPRILAELGLMEAPDDDVQPLTEPGERESAVSPPRPAPDTVLQLKIALKGSK
ncbi:hypothetical protein, partial [Arthrobacter sp. Br18]|uniref:hypothetical protein n=1 Tax=Arthrobacter sp. Br18 TaxID=1312954 RepID=UPI00055F9951